MEAFWREWEWLVWTILGGIAVWAVLEEARPEGQGRERKRIDDKLN